jgi:hypothetical protein
MHEGYHTRLVWPELLSDVYISFGVALFVPRCSLAFGSWSAARRPSQGRIDLPVVFGRIVTTMNQIADVLLELFLSRTQIARAPHLTEPETRYHSEN